MRRLRTIVGNNLTPIVFDVGSAIVLNIEIENLGNDPLVSLQCFGKLSSQGKEWPIAMDTEGWQSILINGADPYLLGADQVALISIDVSSYQEIIFKAIASGQCEILTSDFLILSRPNYTKESSPIETGGILSINGYTDEVVVLTAEDVGAIAEDDLPSLPDELVIPFNFNSPSPLSLWTGSGMVREVIVCITQAFTDVTANLSVGDSANNQRLMSTDFNILSEAANFTSHPHFTYISPTIVRAYFNFGISSAGSGKIILLF